MAESSIFPEEQLSFPISVGDAFILEILIRSYYAVLCRFAEKFLPDASLAQDVVQESYIKVWKTGKSFNSEEALKAYLFTTVRNGCFDLIRSRTRLDNRHRQVAAGSEAITESVLPSIIRAEYLAQIYQLVKEMPEKMQQVFFLSFREGMTVSEIAAHLGVNVKSVKKQKYKALVVLRKRLTHNQQSLLIVLTAVAMKGQ